MFNILLGRNKVSLVTLEKNQDMISAWFLFFFSRNFKEDMFLLKEVAFQN